MSAAPDSAAPGLAAEASLFAPAAATRLGGSVVASLALHLGILAAALLALGAARPEYSAAGDVVEMEFISVELFVSESDASSDSSASLAMLAAGDPGASAPPVPVQPVDLGTPAPPDPEAPVPTPPPPVAALPPAPAPLQAAPLLAAPLPVATDPAPEPPPAEELRAEESRGEAPAPEPPPPTPAKVEKPQKKQPSEKPPEAKPAAKPKVVSGGKGGRSDADSAASTSSAAKKGSAGTGLAAVSKYPGLVQKALRRALRYPRGAGRAGGEARVEFTVSAAGKVSGIRVVVSTGNVTLDAEAVRTVERAAPFPAIPADAGRKTWTFTMPLLFKR